MKKTIIFLLALVFSLYAYPQNENTVFLKPKESSNTTDQEKLEKLKNKVKDQTENKVKEEKTKETGETQTPTNPYNTGIIVDPPLGSQKDKRVIEDSAFYQHFIKRNGWFEGHGPKLTLKEASHLSCYYKFSKKNDAGHWTLMQAYDGYGNLTTNHSYAAYILDQNDENDVGANRAWKEKMQSMCQIEIIGSYDGKEVIQERSLDASGNVVFAGIPTRTGRNTYLYSYIDSWGRPAYIRTDSLGNDLGYANFVEVTRDDRGFEILYKFTDRNGIPAKNKDGAFMSRREYDDEGNELKSMSLNILGNRMIDDFGNCGMEYTYDKRGNMLTAMSHNEDWKPESHSQTKRSSLDDNTCGYWFKYDRYGREIERGFLDTLGNPCVNRYGVFRIVREYNDHGLVIHAVSYDEYSNKTPMDSLGIAEYLNDINSNGYYTSAQSFDAQGKLQNNADGICKMTWTFNGNDEIEETKYQIVGDSVMMQFHYEHDSIGNELRVWPLDDLIRVDSVDNRGNETLLAYYDLSFRPKDNWGFHKRVSSYKYEDKKRTLFQKWIDKEGRPADEEYANGHSNGYSSQIIITDTLSHKKIRYQYFYDVLLRYAYVQEMGDDMNTILAQYDITSSGEQARVGWWDNLHYKAIVEYDYNNDIKSMIGENEFGEPSYLLSTDDDYVFHYRVNDKCFDENGNEIPDSTMSDFINNLPKVFCVEITDTTTAYPLGLRNGDIILSYGNWRITEDLQSDFDYFYLEAVLQTDHSKGMTILRHHPESNSSEVIVLQNLPKGRISDLGFYPHKIYYTQKEKQRLLKTYEKYGKTFIPYTIEKDTTILLALQTKGGFESTRLYHLSIYNIKDPGVVLYAKEKYNKRVNTWSLLNTIDKWESQKMFRIKGANLYITQDLTTTRHIDKQSRGLAGMRFVPIKVDIDTYNKLLKCYNSLGESITSETISGVAPPSVLKLKEKQLWGAWMTIVNVDDYDVLATLELSKGGKASFKAETKLHDESMSVGLVINSIGGTWSFQNSCITIDFENAVNDFDITSFDMPGIDEEQKDAMVSLLRGYLENEGSSLLESYGITQVFNSNTFVVMKVKSKELVVIDGMDERSFTKIKKK